MMSALVMSDGPPRENARNTRVVGPTLAPPQGFLSRGRRRGPWISLRISGPGGALRAEQAVELAPGPPLARALLGGRTGHVTRRVRGGKHGAEERDRERTARGRTAPH